jgi:hypothetical protein
MASAGSHRSQPAPGDFPAQTRSPAPLSRASASAVTSNAPALSPRQVQPTLMAGHPLLPNSPVMTSTPPGTRSASTWRDGAPLQVKPLRFSLTGYGRAPAAKVARTSSHCTLSNGTAPPCLGSVSSLVASSPQQQPRELKEDRALLQSCSKEASVRFRVLKVRILNFFSGEYESRANSRWRVTLY